MISTIFGERWQAYLVTVVRFDHPQRGTLLLRPSPDGQLGDFLGGPGDVIHVMTAHNPGRQLSSPENDKRQAQLWQQLAERPELTVWPAVGGDPAWTHYEQSAAITGLTDEEAVELARAFDQDAIFAWRADAWTLLSCRDDRQWSSGWTLTPADAVPAN